MAKRKLNWESEWRNKIICSTTYPDGTTHINVQIRCKLFENVYLYIREYNPGQFTANIDDKSAHIFDDPLRWSGRLIGAKTLPAAKRIAPKFAKQALKSKLLNYTKQFKSVIEQL